MNSLAMIWRALAAALLFVGFGFTPAHADQRFLIVATDYTTSGNPSLVLQNPLLDGQRITSAFARAGHPDVRMVANPSPETLEKELARFAATLTKKDFAMIYIAGHAVQLDGENYLLAADGFTLIALGSIIRDISQSAAASLFILDACRNNPFAVKAAEARSVNVLNAKNRALTTIMTDDLSQSRSGLSQIADLRGLSSIVFFSTEPGNVALDGEPGEGSPFANVLSEEIPKRQSLDALLRRTATRVNRVTEGAQSPWRQGDIPIDVFIAGMKAMAIP